MPRSGAIDAKDAKANRQCVSQQSESLNLTPARYLYCYFFYKCRCSHQHVGNEQARTKVILVSHRQPLRKIHVLMILWSFDDSRYELETETGIRVGPPRSSICAKTAGTDLHHHAATVAENSQCIHTIVMN